MPAHLATSPLPDALGLMKEGLRELRKQSLAGPPEDDDDGDSDLLRVSSSDQNFYSTVSAVVNMEDMPVVVTMDTSSDSVTDGNCRAINMATQTDMTGLQVETIAKKRVPSSSNLCSDPESKATSDVTLKSSSDTRQKRRRRKSKKSGEHKKDSSHLDVASQGSGSSCEFPEEAMFDMDMDEDELDFSRPPAITMTSMGRTVSMPIIRGKNKRVDEWANTQYASHFHPFSDGDITPIVR